MQWCRLRKKAGSTHDYLRHSHDLPVDGSKGKRDTREVQKLFGILKRKRKEKSEIWCALLAFF